MKTIRLHFHGYTWEDYAFQISSLRGIFVIYKGKLDLEGAVLLQDILYIGYHQGIYEMYDVLSEHDEFIVIEEHQKSCGAGSAFVEQVSDLYYQHKIGLYPHILRIAINDKFYHVAGNQQELREMAGLLL